jgi:hypothetical protein
VTFGCGPEMSGRPRTPRTSSKSACSGQLSQVLLPLVALKLKQKFVGGEVHADERTRRVRTQTDVGITPSP